MRHPGLALQLVAVALTLGEGFTWLALGWLAVCVLPIDAGGMRPSGGPSSLSHRALLALDVLGGAPWGLLVYAVAGACAWRLGPYGLLRLGTLGHCLPVLAWPLVARAARILSPAQRARVAWTFVIAVLVALCVGAALSLPWRERLQAWVRLNRFIGEQSLRPGGASLAAGGLYYHRLKMAHVLLLALAWPLALMAVPRRRHPKSRALLAAACAAALGAALGYTFARAAYLGAAGGAAAVGAALLARPRAPRRHLALGALGCVVALSCAVAAAPEVRARALSSRSPEAAAVRAVIWTEAVAIVWEHPYGIGLGNYPQVVARYYAAADPLTKSPRTLPHNLLWMAWAEGGLVGLCGLALFWTRLGRVAWAALVRTPGAPDHARRAGAALLFVTVAFVLVGCTHDVLFHNIVALSFFSALGLVTQALPEAQKP